MIGAEIADINADGSPEIYVYVRESDPKKLMTLVAYSANKKKSYEHDYPASPKQSTTERILRG